MIYEILEPIEEEKGFAALPTPSAGDVFLDFEGDQYAFGTGVEYLLGSLMDDSGKDPVYEPQWSFDPFAEKQAFGGFITKMLERCG